MVDMKGGVMVVKYMLGSKVVSCTVSEGVVSWSQIVRTEWLPRWNDFVA